MHGSDSARLQKYTTTNTPQSLVQTNYVEDYSTTKQLRVTVTAVRSFVAVALLLSVVGGLLLASYTFTTVVSFGVGTSPNTHRFSPEIRLTWISSVNGVHVSQADKKQNKKYRTACIKPNKQQQTNLHPPPPTNK